MRIFSQYLISYCTIYTKFVFSQDTFPCLILLLFFLLFKSNIMRQSFFVAKLQHRCKTTLKPLIACSVTHKLRCYYFFYENVAKTHYKNAAKAS